MLEQRKSRPNVFDRLRTRWCRLMHDSPMWPIGGHYQCRSCGRTFLVPWTSESAAKPVQIWIRPERRVAKRAA
jgi:hypothetical protein